jgi:hypothetical protein
MFLNLTFNIIPQIAVAIPIALFGGSATGLAANLLKFLGLV